MSERERESVRVSVVPSGERQTRGYVTRTRVIFTFTIVGRNKRNDPMPNGLQVAPEVAGILLFGPAGRKTFAEARDRHVASYLFALPMRARSAGTRRENDDFTSDFPGRVV